MILRIAYSSRMLVARSMISSEELLKLMRLYSIFTGFPQFVSRALSAKDEFVGSTIGAGRNEFEHYIREVQRLCLKENGG
jgi:hypothetical protein